MVFRSSGCFFSRGRGLCGTLAPGLHSALFLLAILLSSWVGVEKGYSLLFLSLFVFAFCVGPNYPPAAIFCRACFLCIILPVELSDG